MKYYLIAGEASGDLHGANLMKGLKMRDPKGEFRFWGGDLMQEQGGTLVSHYRDTAVMGFVEVVSFLPLIAKRLIMCKQDILEFNPDVVVLIDYPGFNMKIAKFAKRHGFKVFYYIPPKLWARGSGRIRHIKKYVDGVFAIFPFEVDYFQKRGVKVHYFGNPLVDSVLAGTPKFRGNQSSKVVALLLGSRKFEIEFLGKRVTHVVRSIKSKYPDTEFILAAPEIDLSIYDQFFPKEMGVKIVQGDTYSVLKSADAAIISSGTASLEAALIGTPQVVCYGFNAITYFLARIFVRIKYISLANIICNKLLFKELIQNKASSAAIEHELEMLLYNEEYINQMKSGYDNLYEILGGGGSADRIAQEMMDILRKFE